MVLAVVKDRTRAVAVKLASQPAGLERSLPQGRAGGLAFTQLFKGLSTEHVNLGFSLFVGLSHLARSRDFFEFSKISPIDTPGARIFGPLR